MIWSYSSLIILFYDYIITHRRGTLPGNFVAVQWNAMHCTVHCTAHQCNAMECNVMQCDAMQWNAVQCSARQCKATCAFPSPCGPKHTQTKTAFIIKLRNTKYTPPTSKMRNTKYTPPASQDTTHNTQKETHKCATISIMKFPKKYHGPAQHKIHKTQAEHTQPSQ